MTSSDETLREANDLRNWGIAKLKRMTSSDETSIKEQEHQWYEVPASHIDAERGIAKFIHFLREERDEQNLKLFQMATQSNIIMFPHYPEDIKAWVLSEACNRQQQPTADKLQDLYLVGTFSARSIDRSIHRSIDHSDWLIGLPDFLRADGGAQILRKRDLSLKRPGTGEVPGHVRRGSINN